MIVLDEHLMGLGLDRGIEAWYEGQICYITDLRLNTVIKDEAIPSLLAEQRQPTFVTTDVSGAAIHNRNLVGKIVTKNFWAKGAMKGCVGDG